MKKFTAEPHQHFIIHVQWLNGEQLASERQFSSIRADRQTIN